MLPLAGRSGETHGLVASFQAPWCEWRRSEHLLHLTQLAGQTLERLLDACDLQGRPTSIQRLAQVDRPDELYAVTVSTLSTLLVGCDMGHS